MKSHDYLTKAFLFYYICFRGFSNWLVSSFDEILSKTTKLLLSILTKHDILVCFIIENLDVLTGELVHGDIDACWEIHLKDLAVEPI